MKRNILFLAVLLVGSGASFAERVKKTITMTDGSSMEFTKLDEKTDTVTVTTQNGQTFIVRKTRVTKIEEAFVPDDPQEKIEPPTLPGEKEVKKMSLAEASELFGVDNPGMSRSQSSSNPYKPFLENARRANYAPRRSSSSSVSYARPRSITRVFVNGRYAGSIADMGGYAIAYDY